MFLRTTCSVVGGVVLGLAAGAAAQAGPPFAPRVWPHAPPAGGTPFPRSKIFTTVEFTGRYATYGGADTWYPSWAADGNLYTPWTDGGVSDMVTGQKVSSASGCRGADCSSTTGYATVVGDDPLNLTVTDVATFNSYTLPYKGRYPCGSLVYNGTWFYGTYTLDNENHQPGRSRGIDSPGPEVPEVAGYCENWCIQGPFVGFRTSTNQGKTWNEPRLKMQGWDDNIFGEQAPDNHTHKVKFGAPHVVDFGQELEHAPDNVKLLYVVGHGASESYSPTSWMQGSEVHLARVPPTAEAVADRSAWEFWSGPSAGWTKGDVGKAAPIVSWGNKTGVTTMTYVPAIQRFIMVVSTPTFSPFTEQQFDTYLLEGPSATGPWSMITYMKEFGPQSYFVNIPSKFIKAKLDPDDGSLTLYLSYSANFHFPQGANPPGSGYHWTLSEIKLRPN